MAFSYYFSLRKFNFPLLFFASVCLSVSLPDRLDIIVRYPESHQARPYISDFFSFNVSDASLPAIHIAYKATRLQGKTLDIVLDRPYVTPNAAATIHLYV
jgi:hypothetical protein